MELHSEVLFPFQTTSLVSVQVLIIKEMHCIAKVSCYCLANIRNDDLKNYSPLIKNIFEGV